MLLHTCASGLNFHDVLNVLGEYRGESDTDAAGVVTEYEASASLAIGDATFGLGLAPFACITCSIAVVLARKPPVISFERTYTLSVTWSTTHAALQ